MPLIYRSSLILLIVNLGNRVNSVFISYRRRDDAYAAAYLDEYLSHEFGAESIFRAGRSIPAGENYEACLRRAVEECVAMLVIVGPTWVQQIPETVDSVDWVHFEIIAAIRRNIPVVPILLSGVSRIAQEELSSELAPMSKFQYLRFDYRNTAQDLAHIASELRRSGILLDAE
jgi:hypothetical protein